MILVPQTRIDEYTARGWWGTQTLWDLFVRHLDERPHAQAVVGEKLCASVVAAEGHALRLQARALVAEVA